MVYIRDVQPLGMDRWQTRFRGSEDTDSVKRGSPGNGLWVTKGDKSGYRTGYNVANTGGYV